MDGIEHLKTGRPFALKFVSSLLSWGKSGTTIDARMHIGVIDHLTVFKFTVGLPSAYFQTVDQSLVSKLLRRAIKISPDCEPLKGDLAVFDGRCLLMFRRFDEQLSLRLARDAAREVACYILMGPRSSPPNPNPKNVGKKCSILTLNSA